jgi:hypothetical protein
MEILEHWRMGLSFITEVKDLGLNTDIIFA